MQAAPRRIRTPDSRRRWPVAVAAIVLLLALAALLPGMLRQWPAEGSQDVVFVRQMTQHHLQAIDMATRLRDRTQNRELRALALDIMLSQQDQVGQMRGWLSLWGLPWGGSGMTAEHAAAMGMATPAQVQQISTLPLAQAERQFLGLMIRHHQGALQMAGAVANGNGRSEVRTLARQIIATQRGEISLMQELLSARGGPLPAPAPAMDGMGSMDMGGHSMPPADAPQQP
ncbi:DUF305 domain-containing protein [Deinococcus sonorensis]|uniref:DUF305 domain-containing protein n=2 Tax=Deinococcus sonorensis TaxID=309891 RepID=A0AAU7UDE0_9DEIO